MLKVRYSAKFRKDFKLIIKRGHNIALFEEVVMMLRDNRTLPEKYCDHALKVNIPVTESAAFLPL